jgi:hypothetical protein
MQSTHEQTYQGNVKVGVKLGTENENDIAVSSKKLQGI